MTVDTQAPRANGLKTVWDTIVAPKDAFESIRLVPTWGWALALTIVLTMIGSALLVPALQHAIAASWPEMLAKSPQLSQMPAAQQQTILGFQQKAVAFSPFFWIFTVPLICLIEALVLLAFDKLGRGEGTFSRYFAVACNIGFATMGLGTIVLGVIARARGAESFTTQVSVQQAMPSLGMVIPATGKLGIFLSTFTPFNLWAVGLAVAALLIVGRVPKLQAWLGAIVLFLIPSLFAVAFAK